MPMEIHITIADKHSVNVWRHDKDLNFMLTPKVRYEILQLVEKQLEEAAILQHGNDPGHLDARLAR
jgi:hypothetical protein